MGTILVIDSNPGGGFERDRGVYSELAVATDRRDFVAEAGAELRDALVYLGAELVRLRRAGRIG